MKILQRLRCAIFGHQPMWPVQGRYYCQQCHTYVPVCFEITAKKETEEEAQRCIS